MQAFGAGSLSETTAGGIRFEEEGILFECRDDFARVKDIDRSLRDSWSTYPNIYEVQSVRFPTETIRPDSSANEVRRLFEHFVPRPWLTQHDSSAPISLVSAFGQ